MRQTLISIAISLCAYLSFGQSPVNTPYWHGKERYVHYKPEGEDFVITNGTRKFNRALYGTNTAFRVETGDLPEFAMYMPGMGGNLKFGISTPQGSKWLPAAESITARYRPGSMLYEIHDPLLGKGSCLITVLAMSDDEGMIVRTEFRDVPDKVTLFCAFGGASGGKFSRDGDLNVDPESSFYLKPANCKTNEYQISNNLFTLYYGAAKVPQEDGTINEQEKNKGKRILLGMVPPGSQVKTGDASLQENPLQLFESQSSSAPVFTSRLDIKPGQPYFFVLQNPGSRTSLEYSLAQKLFDRAEDARKILAGRIRVETPDPYINTLGGALAVAADAIWEDPTFMHGAIGWRMRLNGWRGPYTADPLGWHDRARTHFSAYAKSQVTSPDSGPSVPDPEKNLARQQEKMGTALFTSGYICRNPNGKLSTNHYDMNLVYIDALIRHFNWTGDVSYVKEMWPVLKRHLAWEKRNFDGDNDGLYDAYCCIWASDALEYNGSGVAHSSAYNYLANKSAAFLATLIGEDPEPYRKEADKIFKAMNSRLWMPSKGWYAEYQDLFGSKELHPSAALWTVYHTIDSEVPDAFQAYQMTRYVDTEIPHIPVLARDLPDKNYYVLSTSHWMPYDWSLNNVVEAENLHTALAYWQAGRSDAAFTLWKGTLLDAMYLGSCPGNFVQMSFYDAARGESYRDFADEVGMTSRSLVEGLFGISPNALNGLLTVRPGFPSSWDHAAIQTPDLSFNYMQKGNIDTYSLRQLWNKPLNLKFVVKARAETVKLVKVNGKKTNWKNVDNAVGCPEIVVDAPSEASDVLVIEWQGNKPDSLRYSKTIASGDAFTASCNKAQITSIFDPQHVWKDTEKKQTSVKSSVDGDTGARTVFVELSQGQLIWWEPVCFDVKKPIELVAPLEQPENNLVFSVRNNTSVTVNGKVTVNPGTGSFETEVNVKPGESSAAINVPADKVRFGSNAVQVLQDNGKITGDDVINWNVSHSQGADYETVDLLPYFNDQVTHIFTNKYLSPRSPYPTLALPSQGIGNWCYPTVTANIDDSGLRQLAGQQNKITLPQGIPFATPGTADTKNIVFTSLWDNYPKEVSIPLSGKASHAYFLAAGSTNPMQSQLTNGKIVIEYTDGTQSVLELRNPETWWPIEQDYMTDDYAFSLSKPVPVRVHLKTGLMTRHFDDYTNIKGFSTYAIDGGAATVLDLPLNPEKQLKSLKLQTTATEVVVGLMSVTLCRNFN